MSIEQYLLETGALRADGAYSDRTEPTRYSAEHRRDAVDALRRAVPGLGAVAGLRAARETLKWRSHPAYVAAREAVADIPDVDTPDAAERKPDPWSARKHDAVAKRTRKGRTTVEVKRRGVAPVVGSWQTVDAPTSDDAVSDRAILARSLAVDALRSEHVRVNGRTAYGVRDIVTGRTALDVQRITDRCYASLDVPPMLGTDVMSWEQIVTAPDGVDPMACCVTERRSGLTGRYDDTRVDSLAAHTDVYRQITASATRWPARGISGTGTKVTKVSRETGQVVQGFALPIGRNRADDVTASCRPSVLRTVSEPFKVPTLATALAWSLVAPAAESTTRRDVAVTVTRAPRVIVRRDSLRGLPWRRWDVRDSLTYAPMSNHQRETVERIGRTDESTIGHRWQGHVLVTRPAPRSKRSTRVQRAAATEANERRTIGTVDAPMTSQGWRELLDNLNRGERLKVTSETGDVTVTRSKQRYEARDKRTGREHIWRTRSAATLAEQLS